jgi:hypothetical protein
MYWHPPRKYHYWSTSGRIDCFQYKCRKRPSLVTIRCLPRPPSTVITSFAEDKNCGSRLDAIRDVHTTTTWAKHRCLAVFNSLLNTIARWLSERPIMTTHSHRTSFAHAQVSILFVLLRRMCLFTSAYRSSR